MQPSNFIGYDIESFPNFFSLVAYDLFKQEWYTFEVSWRVNQLGALLSWLEYWQTNDYYMIGFNNLSYDYPMLHELMTGYGYHDAASIYTINQRIINTPWEDRYKTAIPPWQVLIKQLDLFKINHFDNLARSTSLKKVEFAMRSTSIEESKHPFGVPLPETDQAANETLFYNKWDVNETVKFAVHCWKAIQFRFNMSEKYNKDFTNHNDGKIGRDYMLMELKKAGVETHDVNGNKFQTIHTNGIPLRDCIFNYVRFERPEFQQVLDMFMDKVVYETKGALKVSTTLDGFTFDFGLGGIHGSVKGQDLHEDDEYEIVDADVTSYYPRLGIVNKVFPNHLSVKFCDVYNNVFEERTSYAKGTTENKALKLALNVPYGDSNSGHSSFFDTKYTMTITVNGQLLLCMLAEQLMKIPNLTMIQINTDGLTVKMPRKYRANYDAICDWWQKQTGLNLEFVPYKRMIVRDVNNYIAIGTDNKAKFKGAYVFTGASEDSEYDNLDWNKNHSALVVKKAVANCVLTGKPVDYFIRNHPDIYDFFLLSSVGKTSGLEIRKDIYIDGMLIAKDSKVADMPLNVRYLVTNDGHRLVKTMPPVKRRSGNVSLIYPNWVSKKATGYNKNFKATNLDEFNYAIANGYQTKDGGNYTHTGRREFDEQKGELITVCNSVENGAVDDYDINFDYYIDKANKLISAMMGIDYE